MSQNVSEIYSRKPGRGHRLRQMIDVSSEAPNVDDALVWDGEVWKPEAITPDLSAIESDIDDLETDVFALEGDVVAIEGDITTIESILTTLDGDIDTVAGNLSSHTSNTSNPHSTTFAHVAAPQHAAASSGLGLSTTITDIPGCTLTLPTAGTYWIMSTVRINYDSASVAVFVYLNENGTNGTAEMYQHDSSGTAVLTFIRQVITASTNIIVKLRASESSSADSTIIQSQTGLFAIKVG